jgi:hypothetical protein
LVDAVRQARDLAELLWDEVWADDAAIDRSTLNLAGRKPGVVTFENYLADAPATEGRDSPHRERREHRAARWLSQQPDQVQKAVERLEALS